MLRARTDRIRCNNFFLNSCNFYVLNDIHPLASDKEVTKYHCHNPYVNININKNKNDNRKLINEENISKQMSYKPEMTRNGVYLLQLTCRFVNINFFRF